MILAEAHQTISDKNLSVKISLFISQIYRLILQRTRLLQANQNPHYYTVATVAVEQNLTLLRVQNNLELHLEEPDHQRRKLKVSIYVMTEIKYRNTFLM